MREHETTIRFRDEAEAGRFHRLLAEGEAARIYLDGGCRTAHNVVLPALRAGHYGVTADSIDKGIAYVLRGAIKPLRDASDDERFLYCLGYESVVRPARDAALMAVGVGAGIALAAAAMPISPGPEHALASPPTARPRRPLRLEDFGALPGRRS